MDYAALYQKKLTTAAEAVKVIKSGDWVDYGWCTNHPLHAGQGPRGAGERSQGHQGPRRRDDVDTRDLQGGGRR